MVAALKAATYSASRKSLPDRQKYQRQEDCHIDLVRGRLSVAASIIDSRRRSQNRKDDAKRRTMSMTRARRKGGLCGIDAASHKIGILQSINDCMKMSYLYLIS
jgi:hypothetical protein